MASGPELDREARAGKASREANMARYVKPQFSGQTAPVQLTVEQVRAMRAQQPTRSHQVSEGGEVVAEVQGNVLHIAVELDENKCFAVGGGDGKDAWSEIIWATTKRGGRKNVPFTTSDGKKLKFQVKVSE